MRTKRIWRAALLAAIASSFGCTMVLGIDQDYTTSESGSGGSAAAGSSGSNNGSTTSTAQGAGGSGGEMGATGNGGSLSVGSGGAGSAVGAGGSAPCAPSETRPCYSGDPVTEGVGPCTGGTQTCDNGEWGDCVEEVTPLTETCNGIDDDCNGQADDGLGSLSCGVGECAATVPACIAGQSQTCNPKTPTAEVCDGKDNNCNGQTDEGDPGGGPTCVTGLPGICSVGTKHCQAGTLVCMQNAQPSTEICDGLDNDCDSATDENNPGGTCTTGLPGVCAAGITNCLNGSLACTQNVQASAEVCDGLDNDCDGATDENNPGGGGTCTTGLPGVCSAGTNVCQSGALVCTQNVQPSAETCDAKDNDCDGQTDEGLGGQSCNTGNYGICAAGTMACSSGVPVCNQNNAPGTETCDGLDNDCDGSTDEGVKNTYCRDYDGDGYGTTNNTMQACSAPSGYVVNCSDCNDSNSSIKPGAVELCDAIDNNCNGSTDEGNPGGGQSCNTGNYGICAAGTTACSSGVLICNQNNQPAPNETCDDGLDNDCNGVVDSCVCTPGTSKMTCCAWEPCCAGLENCPPDPIVSFDPAVSSVGCDSTVQSCPEVNGLCCVYYSNDICLPDGSGWDTECLP